ncbi:MAG: hypothetical protein ACFCUQ_14315 [Kiloniellales bacterium]
MRRTQLIAGAAGLLLCAAALSGPAPMATAADPADPDWPCIQRKVPQVSPGMVWAGPPVEELEADWRQDVEVSQLAGTIARRAVPPGEAERLIADFAAGLDEERNEKLTLLFDATLSIINSERGSLIAGISRYARRQAALAERIHDMTATLNELPADGSNEIQAKREELQEALVWDTRIFEEREQSLQYVCEQPVMLEQRIFRLARAIMAQLEE